MANQLIPLTTQPTQSFQVALNIDDKIVNLTLTIRYNEIAKYWLMSISDPATGEYILDSIPLLTGQYPAANILSQYAYMEIGSAYILRLSDISQDYPDNKILGSDFVLVWGDTPIKSQRAELGFSKIPVFPPSPVIPPIVPPIYIYNPSVTPFFGFDLNTSHVAGFDAGSWES